MYDISMIDLFTMIMCGFFMNQQESLGNLEAFQYMHLAIT